MATPAKYVHTSIVARDWKRLARFYVEVFGCRPRLPERDLSGAWLERLTKLRGPRIRGIHLSLPGFAPDGPTLEIFQYSRISPRRPSRPNTAGLAHLAFAVRNVRRTLANVRRHGGNAVGELVSADVAGVGEITVVYARDPEGNIVELQRWS
jgi:predicted enzyme related to lactoylglutathione lyase